MERANKYLVLRQVEKKKKKKVERGKLYLGVKLICQESRLILYASYFILICEKRTIII